jgi:uncharacterized repeat protein (TIGR01451 family)
MARALRQLGLMLLAGSLCFGTGCFGVTQNPGYFPHWLPTGDVIPTHAKPPGSSYFSNFDPHAIRLEVRPADERTNPVRTPYVLIATVRDEKGQPRRKRRVEWLIEGEGNIIEVDESGVFPGRGYKVNSKYAVSYTDYHEHTITRGNGNPNDDFVIRPGQTWCVISSAREGDTNVTVYAPEIHDWDKSKVYVTCRWVDANWIFPLPSTARAGAAQVLTTKVYRHTDQQPLARYRVRYTIKDGPDAVFLPSRTREFVAVSDLNGNAQTAIVETAPMLGVSKVGIEIIRPPDPTAPSGAGVTIARGETTVEWLAPNINMTQVGPTMVGLGQEATFTTSIQNTGRVESKSMTVSSDVPDGLQFVSSQPPAIINGKQLIWTLGTLPPGQTHAVQTVYRALREGTVRVCANVVTEEGLKDRKCADLQVTKPGLKVTMTAPTTAGVGVPIIYQITVTNTGNGPADEVVLKADFEPGLEFSSKANPLYLKDIKSLAPQESRSVTLPLTATKVGQFKTRITVTAAGGLIDQAEHTVSVQQPKLTLDIDGPKTRYKTRPADFTLKVANAGDTPLPNVIVRAQLPGELAFQSADQGGKLSGNTVEWSLGPMQARDQRVLKLSTMCQMIAASVTVQAEASTEGGIRAPAQSQLEILGAPGLNLKVGDIGDPVEISKRLIYYIKVGNSGTLPGKDVEIKATVPDEFKIIEAKGASTVTIAGQTVTFAKTDGPEPGKTLDYTIEVEGRKAGDVRFRTELRAASLTTPVIEVESSRIYDAAPANTGKK